MMDEIWFYHFESKGQRMKGRHISSREFPVVTSTTGNAIEIFFKF
jgi:hypothetical protein